MWFPDPCPQGGPAGSTAVVTGATSGLGLGLLRALAGLGMRVVAHGRDSDRCRAVTAEVRQETENEGVHPCTADFARLREVDALAAALSRRFPRIDLLVNNAGIGTVRPGEGRRVESADGYELRFAVNYLAAFWLSERLRGAQRASGAVRLVNVVSGSLRSLDFDDLLTTSAYDGATAYGRSKLALLMDGHHRLRLPGHRVVCVNPGWYIPTGMHRPGRPVRDDLETGVDRIVHAARSVLSDAPVGILLDRGAPAAVPKQATDRAQSRRLRQESLRLVTRALATTGGAPPDDRWRAPS